MFNPEFRYILIDEQNNNGMLPMIDATLFAGIFVCGANFLVIGTIFWMAYKLFCYSGIAAKYVFTALWNSLTPGNEWFDLSIIIISLTSAIIMFISLKGMGDILENGFIKLKNELNKKDERIRELEAKILSFEEKSSVQSKVNIKIIETEEATNLRNAITA